MLIKEEMDVISNAINAARKSSTYGVKMDIQSYKENLAKVVAESEFAAEKHNAAARKADLKIQARNRRRDAIKNAFHKAFKAAGSVAAAL